ncbi:MAG: ATP-dependent protease, partial [Candidatus Parvarchaeota archaeon]|nr:ATP-dependent protease [Candidatus Jingweiarchaeum tengchongense]
MRKTIFSILMLILMSNAFAFSTNTKIVGVRETEKGMEGVVAYLFVEVKNGSGRVFVDTLPLTQVDTQAGARLAKEVACEILQYNCSSLDFFYVIRSNFTMIGGPSASAAMTVATLAALLNKSLLSDVVITGTINPDSSIGPIGGVLEKARAARDAGATLFLIPEGQAIVNVPETKTEQIGPIIRTQTTFKQVNVIDYAKKELNLDVIEVGDVLSAFK